MRVYEIQLIQSKPIEAYVPTGAYKFDPGCGWVWLQSICFWVLDKIGCDYERLAVVDTVRRVIDAEKFEQRLQEAHEEIWRLNYNPKRLYIGSEDYAAMMSEDSSDVVFGFRIEYMQRGTIYNLPVEVIPWMRGVLLV